jgi:hypothetical protein
MDRFPAIKRDLPKSLYGGSVMAREMNDVDWLIAEVERLRKIEDAARLWANYDTSGVKASDNLERTLADNPRPESK